MKKALYLIGVVVLIVAVSFAEGEKKAKATKKAPEQRALKPDSIFQKLGDFITGEYDIHGKPLKEVGVFQAVANEVKTAEPPVVR